MIETKAPDWAKGCGDCSYGILLSPEPAKNLPLYAARLAMIDNTTFCTCKAGVMYEQHLQRAADERDSGRANAAGRGTQVGAIQVREPARQPGAYRSLDSITGSERDTITAATAGVWG